MHVLGNVLDVNTSDEDKDKAVDNYPIQTRTSVLEDEVVHMSSIDVNHHSSMVHDVFN